MGPNHWKNAGVAFVVFWFTAGGIAHFLIPDAFLEIMPPYVPEPLAMVYISGAFELLGAAGLIFHRTRRLAGIGLFALTICVTPANVYMWQHPELFADIPAWMLTARLFVQAALLWLIWWCAIQRRTNTTI